jgi:hypothetical protein
MKIHSNKIHWSDVRECVPEGCYLARYVLNGQWDSIHLAGSRSHECAYIVRLSGSSKRNMQRLDDKSATWDEWGNFINALYEIDPEAKIGPYTSREDFMEQTSREHERVSNFRPDLLPTMSAPWLYSAQPDPGNRLRRDYIDGADGNIDRAASQFVLDLMRGNPATFQAGYTLPNALIAAREIFPDAEIED